MHPSPPFLTRLELDNDADERAIRRAYARQLKQIDQETDPAAFQDLRQAYETALMWAASRAQAAGAEVATVEEVSALATAYPPAAPQSEAAPPRPAQGENPRQLAASVLAEFEAAIPRLPGSQGYWERELKRCLTDERLLNISARTEFEVQLANRLAGGWRPGNPLLLAAAMTVFGWAADRERLRTLGEPGYLLDQAIDEWAAFAALPPALHAEQQRTMDILQTAEPLDAALARRNRARIQHLVGSFPALARVITNPDCAGNWREPIKKLPLWKRMLSDRDGEPLSFQELATPVLVALAIFGLPYISHLGRHDNVEPLPSWAHNRPGVPAHRPEQPPEPPMRPLTKAEQDEILSRVVYTPDPHSKPGRSSIVYDVVIDADGKAFGMNRIEWSGDPAFHAAVKKAILESKPFPKDVRRMFRVGYYVELKPRKVPAAPSVHIPAEFAQVAKERPPPPAPPSDTSE